MMGKRTVGVIYGVTYSAVFGTSIIAVIRDYRPNMTMWVFVVQSAAILVALYLVGNWVAAKKEQNKRIPTSSKELRRQQKRFYDSLESRGDPCQDQKIDHATKEGKA